METNKLGLGIKIKRMRTARKGKEKIFEPGRIRTKEQGCIIFTSLFRDAKRQF